MKAKLSKKKHTDQSGLTNRRFESNLPMEISRNHWAPFPKASQSCMGSTSHITSWVSRIEQQNQNMPVSLKSIFIWFYVPHHLISKSTCLCWWRSGKDIWLHNFYFDPPESAPQVVRCGWLLGHPVLGPDKNPQGDLEDPYWLNSPLSNNM